MSSSSANLCIPCSQTILFCPREPQGGGWPGHYHPVTAPPCPTTGAQAGADGLLPGGVSAPRPADGRLAPGMCVGPGEWKHQVEMEW